MCTIFNVYLNVPSLSYMRGLLDKYFTHIYCSDHVMYKWKAYLINVHNIRCSGHVHIQVELIFFHGLDVLDVGRHMHIGPSFLSSEKP